MEDKKYKLEGRDELLAKGEVLKLLGIDDSGSSAPYSFEFNDSKNHLYFLSNVKNQKNIKNIHYIDMNTESKEIKPLFNYVDKEVELSIEDQLQRERMRTAANGITQYSFDQKHQFIIAPINNKINKIDIKESITKPIIREIVGETYNHQISPDGKIVSFLKDKDIWITDISTNAMYRITFSNDEKHKFRYAGDVGFIYAEEFSRYTGYWWCPTVGTCVKTGKPMYTILYLEEDETDVMDYHIPSTDLRGGTTQYKYPLAGEKNSITKVCLVSFVLPTRTTFQDSKIEIIKNELFDLKIQFPWVEYISRAGWIPSGESIYLQLLDRKQQHLALVLVPLDVFEESSHKIIPKLPLLIEETTKVWINIEFSFQFLKTIKNQLIWSNEQSGYRHLYLIKWDNNFTNIQSTPITLSTLHTNQNNWMVSSEDIHIDEKRKLVYFTGTKDSCLEQHLYVTRFDKLNSDIKRLTHSNFSHRSISISNNFKKFITTYSNISTPSKTEVFDLIYDDNDNDNDNDNNYPNVKSSFFIVDNEYVQNTLNKKIIINTPTIFNFKNSKGITIYGQYTLPIDYSKDKKYPTIIYVYGGPHVQIVRNQYNYIKQHYPNFGFIQVMIDNVGSANRGLEFESHIRERMGQVEINDQIEGIKYLIDNDLVSIDIKRIAISGWSYGGYNSLMAIGQRPDFFKIAISGAPVSDWRHYNTGYTERYMNTPQDNQSGYELGDTTHYIKTFPNEENRLILIHGLQDENVHFSNTVHIVNHLTQHQKPYILKTLPNERHGVRNTDNRIYIDLFVVNHLLKNL
ncbi:hypothetical protein RB653_005937 [Dictyostelium firmibasis]|uniref:Uncharacterized protein n=1 Tax=Dictyostelium firmibasis TaxID=79012 RepID=A0AAN7ULV9_9MYCE